MLVDAFMFFNELDLLEIRLHEMDPIVDYFVIVESLERIASSEPKRAVLRDNWDRVKAFEHKIKYVVLPKLEPGFTTVESAWEREYFNRNALLPAIQEVAGPDDAVIISDLDEIPRMTAIRDTLPHLVKGIHRLNQRMYHYNVNRLLYKSDSTHVWDKAVIGTLAQIQQVGGPQKARFIFRHDAATWETTTHAVKNAGWHFTYFEDGGSIERMREKTESCAHFSDPEERTFLDKDDKQLLNDIVAGEAIRRESRSCVWRETNDPSLPEYFLKNAARFRHFTDAFFRDQLGERP